MIFIFSTTLFILLIYSLPGIILSNLIWKDKACKTERILFGFVIGLSFSCYVSVLTAYFFEWKPFVIIASILIFVGIVFSLTKAFSDVGSIEGSGIWTKNEFIASTACVCFVTVFLFIVFSGVGIETESGYRYSWLFGHDFINKAVNAVSLTHGVPPPHFYFAGESLRYYILSYSISALAYSILGPEYSIHGIVIALSILQAILFVFVITQFFKTWFRTRIIYILLVLSFLSYSFYGIFFILKNQLVNLGAPTALLKFSGVSHLFYRFFLVEPQTVMGLMVFLVVLSIMMRDEFTDSIIPIVMVGFLIGIESGIEPILATFLVLTYGFIILHRFIFRQINFKKLFLIGIVCAIPIIIIYSSFIGIGIVSSSGGSDCLNFHLNKGLLCASPVITLISFGPAVIFSVLALIPLLRKKIAVRYSVFLTIGLLVIFFMLTVSHKNEAIFGYLKGEKILFIFLLIFSGFFFQWVIKLPMPQKKIILLISLIVSMPAFITPITDVYSISFSNDVGEIYVSLKDMEACNWIKRNLSKNAIIQSEPQYPGSKYSYSLIPSFAERKVAIGEWKVSGVKHDKGTDEVAVRYNDIKSNLFKTSSLKEAHDIALIYGINYIYVGPYERKIYPRQSIDKWKKKNSFFKKVYDKQSVMIYIVL